MCSQVSYVWWVEVFDTVCRTHVYDSGEDALKYFAREESVGEIWGFEIEK